MWGLYFVEIQKISDASFNSNTAILTPFCGVITEGLMYLLDWRKYTNCWTLMCKCLHCKTKNKKGEKALLKGWALVNLWQAKIPLGKWDIIKRIVLSDVSLHIIVSSHIVKQKVYLHLQLNVCKHSYLQKRRIYTRPCQTYIQPLIILDKSCLNLESEH